MQRQGAGAVYISAHHPDIMSVLDTKRENADEKIRIKTLSLGLVISDKIMYAARDNEEYYLFSPQDVEREYGIPMSDISITEKYDELANNENIKKKGLNARKLLMTVAELQSESGYPYLMFEDQANRRNNIDGRINMSNLCYTGDTEVLTDKGYKKAIDLYNSQEEINVVVDERARTMNLENQGSSIQKATKMHKTSENADVYEVVTENGLKIKTTEWHKFYVLRGGNFIKTSLYEIQSDDELLTNIQDINGADKIKSIKHIGKEDVFDITVDNGHSQIANGIVTGNCSEILQVNTPTIYDKENEGQFLEQGRDISCNLGSLNVAKVMEKENDFEHTVRTAIQSLTSVSEKTNLGVVASVKNGNDKSHSIGLGAMNLHGFLGENKIEYGSDESLDFVNSFFATMRFFALKESHNIAKNKGETFYDFEKSNYALANTDGHSIALENYTSGTWRTTPQTDKVKALFEERGFFTPTVEDWIELDNKILEDGIYNAYLMAVAPTGSISYVNHSTASVHPIVSQIETRKEGKIGRVYVASPHMTNENRMYFKDAYALGYKPVIDVYSVAQKHVDQGMSLTLFFEGGSTTRDFNKAYIYAWSRHLAKDKDGNLLIDNPETSWKAGFIKTLYYSRVRQAALDGTQQDNACVGCLI